MSVSLSVIRRRRAIAPTVGLLASLTIASAAHAAPPSNDDIGGAVDLTFPSTVVLDTTEATTSADETALNDFCGAPALEHGVWFTATATTSDVVAIDVTGSDYSAGILIAQGSPGALEPLICGPGLVTGGGVPGTTYWILVFGDGLTENTSGQLVVETSFAPPPPAIDLTVDPVASVNRSGIVTLTGTVTCSSDDPNAFLFDVEGTLTQQVGRLKINGFFFSEQVEPCDGITRTWTALVAGDNGVFAGGKAATVAFAFGCGSFDCGSGFVEQRIQLRRNGR